MTIQTDQSLKSAFPVFVSDPPLMDVSLMNVRSHQITIVMMFTPPSDQRWFFQLVDVA